jgi:hypothetical protein
VESVVVSSDVPLEFPVARSPKLDEGSVNPSGLVEVGEAALDNEDSGWPMDPLEESASNK